MKAALQDFEQLKEASRSPSALALLTKLKKKPLFSPSALALLTKLIQGNLAMLGLLQPFLTPNILHGWFTLHPTLYL
ncbi:hypothetical protein HanXRQr2_Chr04g0168191 [Helianthus annuus]|uniref:Uncharacterized protein n=1 Tax=Helianthus annuus TaxID=4232 RepID=A0A9K3NRY6_HELAN|nr:hypothetical protein HanXRQr2_Chr04g0168191 [Helianthus annuus]KAJ0589025.1 hypothetical protein HanIR_Chr04g0181401 [Helianthus annuus]KAJ0931457.1 hypothetical protein HanPSC8_Chr04g0161841 [Helianthus annuus]